MGAQLEPGATAIFQPLIFAARAARTKIGAEGKAMGSDFVGGYRTAPAAAKAAGDALVSATRQTEARITAERRRAAAERDRIDRFSYNFKKRMIEEEARDAERSLAKRQKTITKIGGGAVSTFANAGGRAVGAVGTLARGAGVQLDVGASVGRAVALSQRAVDVVNQAALSGQAQEPGAAKKLESMARNVGGRTGIGAEGAMDVFAAFQAKSSDLATAKTVLPELAQLARATGTNMGDMANAAASVNAQLEDSPDKAQKLLAIMRHITKQTADGQVEMSDFAKYMPRIAAGANAFSGDYSRNLGALGAISQMSIKGGASDAAEATNSAAAFGRDLRKSHTIKAMAQEGLTDAVYGKNHELKDPQEIIIAALKKTGGDQARMARLFSNTSSYRGVEWARHVYTQAGGGEAGEKAVRGEFGKYGATITPEQIKAMSDAANATDAAKVERFNAQLDKIVATSAEKLLPALEQLAPLALSAAQGIGDLATFAAGHPWESLGAVAAASIAKEIAAAGIKSAITSALAGAGGALGPVSLVIAAATIAITAAEIVHEKAEASTTEAIQRGKVATEELNAGIDKGEVTKEQQVAAEKAYMIAQSKIDNAGTGPIQSAMGVVDKYGGPLGDLIKPIVAYNASLGSWGANLVSGGKYGTGLGDQVQQGVDAGRTGELKAEMAGVKAALDRLATSNLKVTVTNQPGAPVGPGAPGTRTGPDAH